MAEKTPRANICAICGGIAFFLDDSHFADWMSVIKRLRNYGKITFSTSDKCWNYINEHNLDHLIMHDLNGLDYSTLPVIEHDYSETVTFNKWFLDHEKKYGRVIFRPMSERDSYTCPCGSNHFLKTHVCEYIDDYVDGYIENRFLEQQKTLINERVDSYVKNNDNEDISAIIPKNVTNSEDVVMFLNHLIKLEKGIRTTREHLYNLELTFAKAKRNAYILATTGREELEEKYNEKIEIITQRVISLPKKYAHTKGAYQSRGIFEPDKPMEIPKFSMELPTEPVPIQARFFNRKKVALQNEENMRAYQNKLQEYTEAKKQYDGEVCVYNRAAEVYEKQKKQYDQLCRQVDIELDTKRREEREQLYLEKKNILKQKAQAISNFEEHQKLAPAVTFITKEIEETKALLQSLIEARTKLRCSGVIHPKYLELAAISTIAEYFETGRVETLVGPSGAYNLYESELRANIIIAKLDTIIDSLEQIKQNQFKLYCVLSSIQDGIDNMSGLLQNANKSLADISTQNKQIIENTAVTAYYSAKTAHYAKLNAELTDALGFMVALS